MAQARASVTYHMIVEGVLAETGYHAYAAALARNEILPGTQEAVGLVNRDESRHLVYGLYLLSRLVAEHGDPVRRAIEDRMDELLQPGIGVVDEVFAAYDRAPFGLELEELVAFASDQFHRRVSRLQRAREEGSLVAEA